jgi:hypothetical protein
MYCALSTVYELIMYKVKILVDHSLGIMISFCLSLFFSWL